MNLNDNVNIEDPVRFKLWANSIKKLFQNFIFQKEITETAVLDFASIASLTSEDLTISVQGAGLNDNVLLGLPVHTSGIIYTGFVSLADTVTVRATNITAGAINPDSATFRVSVLKY